MSNNNEKTRVIVTGIGGRGIWAATKVFQDKARYELVALCEKNAGKLDYIRKHKGFETVPGYVSIAECLEQVDADAVVVTTPDCAHAAIAVETDWKRDFASV